MKQEEGKTGLSFETVFLVASHPAPQENKAAEQVLISRSRRFVLISLATKRHKCALLRLIRGPLKEQITIHVFCQTIKVNCVFNRG